MKKLLALVLALAMMLCMGTAFATEDTETPAPSTAVTVEGFLTKTWKEEETKPGETTYFNEALEFEVLECKAVNNEDHTPATTDITLTKAEGAEKFTLTYDIEGVGVFYYLVKEVDAGTAGVTYEDDEYVVTILRQYEVDGDGVPTTNILTTYDITPKKEETKDGKTTWAATEGDKIEEIVNTYADGELNIKKHVQGNLSEKTDTFTVKVTFTSAKPVYTDITTPDGETIEGNGWTTNEDTITVTGDDSDNIYRDIPVDVKVTISESDCDPYTLLGYALNNGDRKKAADEAIITTGTQTYVITNEYKTDVNTGINMDSMPYIVLMGLVVLAGVALILKKRTVND